MYAGDRQFASSVIAMSLEPQNAGRDGAVSRNRPLTRRSPDAGVA
jgi:hypothetical protein